MDGQRFDRLARAVANGASRRTVLGGLIAGVASLAIGGPRFRVGRAQQPIALGGSCSAFGANAECSQAGTPAGGVPVICSDNGHAADGQFNCCRNAGGVCSSDMHCCGAAVCSGGICGGTSAPTGGTPLGGQCTSTSECSQAGGSVVCGDNAISTDGAMNCCRNEGGACVSGSNCCGGLACINGICGGSLSGGSNLAPGSACNSTAECSQAGGSVVCADNGVAVDGARNCCRNAGGACVNGAGCCAGLDCVGGVCTQSSGTTGGNLSLGNQCSSVSQCSQAGGTVLCADNGYADDGPLNCCRDRGGACFDTVRSADCCFGLYCRNGVCTDLSATGDLPPGSACEAASQCSQDGGPVDCAWNGASTGGATNCCRWGGGACFSDSGCCGDARCVNGVCSGGTPSGGDLWPGAECTSSSQCNQSGGTTFCADNGIATDGALNCCRTEGGACDSGAGCCAGLICSNGTCVSSSDGGGGGGGELPPGSTCTDDSQCSQAGGEVLCRDNGLSTDGERNCCRYQGGACSAVNNSAGCCAGLVCVGGTCQPV